MEAFIKLFRGLDRAFGQFAIKQTGPTGKVEGRATTVVKKITDQAYLNHLNGKTGLGIVPVMDTGTAGFGCIDIDEYGHQTEERFLKRLREKITAYKLPLVLCRSKSGGAHIYSFFKKPIQAKIVRINLKEFAKILGHTNVEIFPKQDSLDEKSTGNWINLPYFDAKKTNRYAFDDTGKTLTLSQFVKFANSKAIGSNELKNFKLLYNNYPPCLQTMFIEGFPTTNRNTLLFNVGVLMQKLEVKDWREKLKVFNKKHFGLPDKEVEQTILSQKKVYFYQCDEPSLNAYCNKNVCARRELGVGSGDKSAFNFNTLQKVLTNPPTWYLTIDNVRLELSVEELMNQRQFKKTCIEKLDKFPATIKQDAWEELVQIGLNNQEIIDAPQDAGPVGTFLDLVEDFCLNRAPAKNKDGVLRGQPWTSDGHTYFKSASLKNHLKHKRFYEFNNRQIWNTLREYLDAATTVINIKGKSVHIWKVTAFEQQTERFDVPKQNEEPF